MSDVISLLEAFRDMTHHLPGIRNVLALHLNTLPSIRLNTQNQLNSPGATQTQDQLKHLVAKGRALSFKSSTTATQHGQGISPNFSLGFCNQFLDLMTMKTQNS